MSSPRTIKEHIGSPGRRDPLPGSRTIAQLMKDPRFVAARKLAKERPVTQVSGKEYAPPDKPIRRYADEELKEACRQCVRCGGMGFLSIDVHPTDSRHGKVYPCPQCLAYKQEARARRDMARMKGIVDQYSMLRGTLLDKSFDNFRRHCPSVTTAAKVVYQWASDIYIQNPKGKPFLYMHGPTGTGKTHLAAAAASGLIAARIPVIFTTFPQLLGMVTSNHFERTEPVIQALQNITVLILDDVRNDNLKSSWACSVLFRVLDHRYVTQSPTMVVSNHPLSNTDPTKAFTTLQQFEPRIASRLGDKSISHVIAVIAKDQRAV